MIYYTIVAAGLILAVMHLTKFLFEMVLSIAFFEKTNIPSVSFIIYHLLLIYIPLLLISPNGKIPKALILKWVLRLIALCYLLGCSWIIYYIIDESFIGLFADNINKIAEFQYNSALMFNYMTWICFSPLNVIFSLFQAFLYYIMTESITEHRAVFSLTAIISALFAILVPIIFVLFKPEPLIQQFTTRLLGYFYDNMYAFGIQLCTASALFTLSFSPNLWEKILWTYSR